MDDRAALETQYREMYRAMVERDIPALEAVLDEGYVLVHMTGMRQGKREFLQAVESGALRYFSAQHEKIDVILNETQAFLTGRSKVDAIAFYAERHTWRLEQKIRFIKERGRWLMTQAVVSTY